MGKIKNLDEIAKISAKLRNQGKKIVTTNGAFDILHAGHARYLKCAKKLGDVLIIGVNSDESVKSYKDKRRPIVPLEERMELLASLECVDYVFPFSEKDPRAWLEKIRPGIHVKGGDYKRPLLEEDVVRKNGGQVKIIPFIKGKSTTNIIEKIKSLYCNGQKAVFLDRDGTINEDDGDFHEAEKLKFFPHVKEGLEMLSGKYMLIVISNQGGIEAGKFPEEDCIEVNNRIAEGLMNRGVKIRKFYYCPHREETACRCRKPNPSMVLEAAEEFDIDLDKSWFIGDKTADIKTAENLKAKYPGFKSILVLTGHAGKDGKFAVNPDFTAKDLRDAAKIILSDKKD